VIRLLLSSALALGACGIAHAQPTIFGVIDTTVTYGAGSISDAKKLQRGGLVTPRLGFRGAEDLGDGLSASFWLEMGLNPDDGSGVPTNTNNQPQGNTTGQGATFGRRAFVAVTGQWGEIRFGRDYVPQYWNLVYADPFGNVGVGTAVNYSSIITGVVSTRASNQLSYLLPPNKVGVSGQVSHWLGENASGSPTSNDGTGSGVQLSLASSSWSLGAAYGSTSYATGRVTQANILVIYDWKVARLVGGVGRDSSGGVSAKGFSIGGSVPWGASEVRGAVSQYEIDTPGSPKVRKYAIGYVYNLSKRTAIYSTYARVSNNGASAVALNGASSSAGEPSSGVDLGLRHSF
jgi:predicted porin